MNKFLRSVGSVSNRDELIKKAIIKQLSDTVKELQYSGVEENQSQIAVDGEEAAGRLCEIIEAIFLHRLKDSLTHRFRRALADVDERPDLNFWAPLLVISHRQIIDQITALSQINTEVGQCRAWIRLALKDSLLSSYFMIMRQDSSVIKNFYRTGAFVRDPELLEVAQKLIEGLESIKPIGLPCNSSLLNNWPLPSLYLAGIWSPTLKSCPVAPCDDVAQAIDSSSKSPLVTDTSETCSLSSTISIGSQQSGLRQIIAMNEDEVLKIILGKMDNVQKQPEEKGAEVETPLEEEKAVARSEALPVGNSLNRQIGWSFDETQEGEVNVPAAKAVEIPPITGETSADKSMEGSFNALIESYNMLAGNYIKTPDIKEVLEKFSEKGETVVNSDDHKGIPDGANLSGNGMGSLAIQVGKICREGGLDSQAFKCAGCEQNLAVTSKPNVCAFTGKYFCNGCMSEEYITIPARIIHNWDFKSYPVSKQSFEYIKEIADHPVIDFKILNPLIYKVIEEMAELQILRNQLNFLRAYLYTCREPVIVDFQKLMWPREYMYKHIHQYSVSDLFDVSNGILSQTLKRVVAFGKNHVLNCWLCSQKGFVCEICDKPKPLFPFDVEHIYRCNECSGVYHKGCLTSSKPCPRCKRRKEREDMPLLGATVE